jgi:hypothetical protein
VETLRDEVNGTFGKEAQFVLHILEQRNQDTISAIVLGQYRFKTFGQTVAVYFG